MSSANSLGCKRHNFTNSDGNDDDDDDDDVNNNKNNNNNSKYKRVIPSVNQT